MLNYYSDERIKDFLHILKPKHDAIDQSKWPGKIDEIVRKVRKAVLDDRKILERRVKTIEKRKILMDEVVEEIERKINITNEKVNFIDERGQSIEEKVKNISRKLQTMEMNDSEIKDLLNKIYMKTEALPLT